jgi:hypothetical protein
MCEFTLYLLFWHYLNECYHLFNNYIHNQQFSYILQKSVSTLILLKYSDRKESLLYTEPMTVDNTDPVLYKPSEPLRKILMTCDTQNSESDGY